MRTFVVVFFFLSFSLAKANGNNEKWKEYLSYKKCFKTAISNEYIYGVCPSGIIKVNTTTEDVTTISRINGLSGLNISAFAALENGDFIVGYEDGNLDLFQNGNFFEISDIKDKSDLTTKRINSFTVLAEEIYISTSFGVVIYNLAKREFKDSWILDIKINGLAVYNNYFLIATEAGILQCDINNPLISGIDSWSLFSSDTKAFKAIQVFADKVLAIKMISSTSYQFFSFDGIVWTKVSDITNFGDLQVIDNQVVVVGSGFIRLYSSDLNLEDSKDSFAITEGSSLTPLFTSAVTSSNGEIWFTDQNYGLLKAGSVDEIFTPDCPPSNNCFRIRYVGNKLVVSPGGLTSSWNNMNFAAQMYFYDENWRVLNSSNSPLLVGKKDIISVSADVNDDSKLYFASWGWGVFVVKDETIIQNYNQYNSLLQNIDWAGTTYVRIGGSVMDKQGNLFMNNGEVNHGIVVLTKDSVWLQYDYKGVNAADGDYYGEMIIDDNSGYVWMTIQRSKKDNGVFVFDINQTVDHLYDDRYRGPLSSSQDNDSRNVGQMDLIDQEGEIVTNIANSLVFDKDGFLWVGTDKGILVNYRPRYVFDDETPRFNRIEIPRNDGTDNIDYLLENEIITSIAVDGANRKWIGTQYSGIYLVSSDGTKTICHFTAENSALLSDYVYSIAINPNNGEVFIATSNGLVSYQGNAVEEFSSMSTIYAYPNPVRPEYKGDITITGLLENSIIKITDVSGNIVYETKSLGGNAIWNGKNAWGEDVKSGVYIVLVSDESGQNTSVTKVMIVR